jgi:phosphotransferase system enzyme I (PtsP)
LSIGGNDLKQFFFAADRENELVRKRYDTLNLSFIDFLQMIVDKCGKNNTTLSFCGEDAGRPVEALCLAAIGIKTLSMRPASIGPVKNILLKSDLGVIREIIDKAKTDGETSVRKKIIQYIAES